MWVVVLDRDDAAIAGLGMEENCLCVQGFDGEGVEDADVGAALLQLIGRLEGLVERHSGPNNQDLVLPRLPHHVRLPNHKLLVVLVDDGRVGPRGPNETNPFRVGSQQHGVLTTHGVRRVKHGRTYIEPYNNHKP